MNNICKSASLGLVIGALALSTGAQAKGHHHKMADAAAMDNTATTPAMGDMKAAPMAGDMSASSMSMTPSPVSGTVTRYYTDRAGFVSAMDVQAADGVKRVHFSPSMAGRLLATAPVGSQIAATVTSSGMNYDLAGVGAAMPTPATMMMPSGASDLSYLRSQPYIQIGTKSKQIEGKLTGAVADPDSGQILAIILDKTTFVRVPMNNRVPQASTAPEGVAPLLKGALVVVDGYEESPRYGTVSPYAKRVVATGVSVNGHTLGAFGFGKVDTDPTSTLFKFNLNFFGGESATEIGTGKMAYTPYDPSGAMMDGGMKDGTMAPGTMAPATGAAAPATGTAMPGM